MGRRPQPDPPVEMKCSICGATKPDSIAAGRAGWDWFTGFLKDRFVACPKCLRDRVTYIAAQRVKSQTKPTA